MFLITEKILHLPNQHNVGCCAASASLLAAELIMNDNARLSRLFPYYYAREMRGRIGQNGAELGDILESMKQYGVATDKTWPFSLNRVNTEPNSSAQYEASQCKLGAYNYVEADSYKSYLEKGIPIIIGLNTGRMFWKMKGPLAEQTYKSINNTDNRKFGGHAVTIIGFNDNLNSWIIANSLGLTWGDHGLGVLPYECNHDIGEAYVITEFAGKTAGKKFLRIDK